VSLTKALRWLSPLLVAATFLPFFGKNSPNLEVDFFLYNSAPLLTLFLTFKSLRKDEKVAKVALRLALICWILGSLLSSITAIYLLSENFQTAANFFYLFFYPFMFIAVPRLLRQGTSSSKLDVIDSAIVALGVSSICSAFLINPILPKFNENVTDTFFAILFPVADVILLALIVSLNPWHRINARSLILSSGVVIFALADFVNLWLSASGKYHFGSWSDSLWLIAIILIAESTWHDRDESDQRIPTHPVFIAVAVLASTLLLAFLAVKPNYLPNFILGPAIATLMLAFIRMFVALKQAQEISSERTLARTDELTGLPNRRKFMADLIEFSNTQGALLLLDLDGFKPVNDQHGHAVGDQLLRAVSQRFRRSLPNQATLARLGGDEFGALITGDYESTMEAALALHASVSYPFLIDGENIKIGVSIGFVINDGTRDMMHRADQAMYKAKREDLGVCQL
jgi:diguanylate cyclase (GGDEF)-like protein